MDKTQITIVGLGQIGTSIGLALEKHGERLYRVGHTRTFGDGNHAKSIGAIDKSEINLLKSVKNAEIVVLALPVDEVKGVLEFIAADLKEGVVVLDTSPTRRAGNDLAQDTLPDNRYYVGFTPVLNPANLHQPEGGLQQSSAELFQEGMFAITSPMGTSSEALKVASDLALMMDAVPLFADSSEVDSYMSSTHLLPQLLAASIANVTVDKPGWDENRKLAGRPYAQLTNLLTNTDPADSLSLAAKLNKEHTLRMMDEVIAELQRMRIELDEDEEAFERRVAGAAKKREKWWVERQVAQWLTKQGANVDMSEAGNPFGMLFGFGKPKPKPRRDQE